MKSYRKSWPRIAAFALGAAMMTAHVQAVAQDPADKAAALAQLDASLPGTLINDPTSLDWPATGDRLKVSPLFDASIPGGGGAASFNVRKAGANPWEVQATAPLTADLAKGDMITYGFWARTISSDAADGKGKLTVRLQKNANPWPGFGDTPFDIGEDWQWYEATATSNVDSSKDLAFLVFQLGGARQQIEIGQTIVVKGADRIMGNGARPAPPLPRQLEGKGQLVNQPDTREWTYFGPESSQSAREDKTIFLGRAWQFTSPSASDQPWDIHANVPLTQDIKAGDDLIIAVAARTVSAVTDDGKAVIGVRVQQAAEPFGGFGDNQFKVGENWQLIQIRTTATIDLPAGTGLVALHMAGAQQVVDLGPTYVIKAAPGGE